MALDEKEECVRSSTTAYASNEPRDVIISFRITRSLAERIESHRKQHHHKRLTKTETIINLLETGAFVIEKADSLQDPVLVQYFREKLYNMQLVDDIMEWPQDRIEAIIGVLASERERRLRIRVGKH